MHGLSKLREKRTEAKELMEGILAGLDKEDRMSLTEEEESNYDDAKKGYLDAGELIDRIQEQDSYDVELSTECPSPLQVPSRQIVNPRGAPAKKEFDTFGDFVGAVLEFRLGKRADQRLDFRADQQMGSGALGGFATPERFATEVMQAEGQGAVIRPLCKELPAGDPPDAELSIPALNQGAAKNIYGGVTLSWVNVENDADLPETSAELRQIKLAPAPVAGVIPVTNQLLRNWSGAGAFYGDLLQKALVHAFEVAFFSGSGAGQPLGFNSVANAALLTVDRAGANAIAYADLIGMEALAFGTNLKWLVSRRAVSKLRLMVDGAGQYIFGGPAGALPGTLLGYPYVINNRGPAAGALGDIILGDFDHYLVKPGSGPYVDVSDQVEFKRYRTVLRIVGNMDGQPWVNAAIESEDGSSTVSPFVSLDVPAA